MSISLAQILHPKASPASLIKQEIGLSTITVQYSRPAVRGRKIFGELVPYGRIWRVGANESTKITLDSDMQIMGNTLTKGTYALYAFPEKDMWEIAFHKNITHWGDGRKNYNQEEDAFRVTIIPQKSSYFQENLLITFDEVTHDSAVMLWIWENTKIIIPITVDTDFIMQQQIQDILSKNPTAQSYYEAARYLQEQEKDYSTALKYLNMAIELGGDTYYFYRVKSLVEAALENYESAINSAQISSELAAKESKDEFVRMNQGSITLWKELVKN